MVDSEAAGVLMVLLAAYIYNDQTTKGPPNPPPKPPRYVQYNKPPELKRTEKKVEEALEKDLKTASAKQNVLLHEKNEDGPGVMSYLRTRIYGDWEGQSMKYEQAGGEPDQWDEWGNYIGAASATAVATAGTIAYRRANDPLRQFRT